MLYLFNFIFAVFAALPLNNFLQSTVAHTLSIQKSLKGFNYAIISDFLNEYGSGLAVIFNQSLVVLFFFLVVSIFLTGGILNCIKYYPSKFEYLNFWRGCTKYFWRLFRLTAYFLILQGLLLLLSFKIYTTLSGGLNFFELDSDKQLIDAFKIILPFYIFFATLLFLFQDYIKLHIVHEEKYLITKPFWEAIVLVFKNIIPVLLLSIFNSITFLAAFVLYWIISDRLPTETFIMIIIVFLISQVFIIARIGCKLINLGSAGWLYKDLSQDENMIASS